MILLTPTKTSAYTQKYLAGRKKKKKKKDHMFKAQNDDFGRKERLHTFMVLAVCTNPVNICVLEEMLKRKTLHRQIKEVLLDIDKG